MWWNMKRLNSIQIGIIVESKSYQSRSIAIEFVTTLIRLWNEFVVNKSGD